MNLKSVISVACEMVMRPGCIQNRASQRGFPSNPGASFLLCAGTGQDHAQPASPQRCFPVGRRRRQPCTAVSRRRRRRRLALHSLRVCWLASALLPVTTPSSLRLYLLPSPSLFPCASPMEGSGQLDRRRLLSSPLNLHCIGPWSYFCAERCYGIVAAAVVAAGALPR